MLDADASGRLAMLAPGTGPAPVERPGNLGELLALALEAEADPLAVTGAAMAVLGIAGGELAEADPFAEAPGWDVHITEGDKARVFGLRGAPGAWRPAARVLWAPADSGHLGPLVSGPSILAALGHFEAAHGTPWQGSGAATFRAMLRASHAGGAGRKVTEALGPGIAPTMTAPANGNFGEGHALAWDRAPEQREVSAGYWVAYDRNGAYLAALGDASWGKGKPSHLGRGPFDRDERRPGWWCVSPPALEAWPAGLPYLLTADGTAPRKVGASLWITTATARFIARDLGLGLNVEHAWAWPDHVDYCRTLGRRLSIAREALVTIDTPEGRAAYGAHKALYSEGINGLRAQYHAEALEALDGEALTRGPELWRPSVQAHIVALARANACRALRKVGEASGHWPAAMGRTDEVLYWAPEPDPQAFAASIGLPLGLGLGQWKPAGAGARPAVDEYRPGAVLELLRKKEG